MIRRLDFKTDAEAKTYADRLPKPARPCSAWDLNFGGECFNCGGVGSAESYRLRVFHAPQPERKH